MSNLEHLTHLDDDALLDLAKRIVKTVEEAGLLGATGEPMYPAFQSIIPTLDQFMSLMESLVGLRLLTKNAERYQIIKTGRAFIK